MHGLDSELLKARQDSVPFYNHDYQALTKGLRTIDCSALRPARLVAFGERAFPVALDTPGSGASIVAARYGNVSSPTNQENRRCSFSYPLQV